MHHGIKQDHIIRFKRNHRLETRFGKKLVRNSPDAVALSLQNKGGIPQVAQTDTFLPGKRMGGRKRYQKFLPDKRDITYDIRVSSGTECQIDLAAADGVRLFPGIKLCQVQGNIRVTPGKLVVDAAVNDCAAVRCCTDADILPVIARYTTHGKHHAVLLIHDLLSVIQDFPPQSSGK